MNLQSLTEALVMRGYRKCDGEGDYNAFIRPDQPHWHMLQAVDSEDGTTWIWIAPPQDQGTDLDLAFQSDFEGTLLTAGVQDTSSGREIATLYPVPTSLDDALKLWSAVAAIWVAIWKEASASEAVLSNRALAGILCNRLPEGAYVSHDLEQGEAA